MNTVRVFNVETGQLGSISRTLFEHPVFNPGILIEAEPGQKPYVPELYRPKTDVIDAAEAEEEDVD